MTKEFFDIEMQRMVVPDSNINERKSLSLMNHIFNIESIIIPSIQDCMKIILVKSPIIINRSAKISPELNVDSRHIAIVDVLPSSLSPPKQQRYMNDFDADDLESHHICYENMFCRENRKRFMKEEEEKEDEIR